MSGSFATLNRLLGKKNKDSSLSKSTSNINNVIPTLDTSSQYNKIVPLAGMSEAPFEQTYRITIQLPRDQLYVARLGAKMKLIDLLNKICDDKQLGRDKFEFRHPADKSQVFNNNLTIGEAGLSEYCLVLKRDVDIHNYNNNNNNNINNNNNYYYNNNNNENLNRINTDDKYKLRDSISSSEMSRNSKIFRKISPYSSTNSLNSIDSSGISSQPPIAPKRKKRTAPRPPSSNSTNDVQNEHCEKGNEFKQPQPVMPRKNFHLSTPNLSNGYTGNDHQKEIHKSKLSINNEELEIEYYNSVTELNKIDPPVHGREHSLPIHINHDSHRNSTIEEHNNNEIIDTPGTSLPNFHSSGHEPIPKQRIYLAAKKKKAAPCPPPRTVPPVPTPRSTTPKLLHVDDGFVEKSTGSPGNVSKIMLNVDNSSYSSSEMPTNGSTNGEITEYKEKILETVNPVSGDTKAKISQSDFVSIKVKSPIIVRANDANISHENSDKISLDSTKTYSSDEDDSKVNVYCLKSTSTVTSNTVHIPNIQKMEEKLLTNGITKIEKIEPTVVVIPKDIDKIQSPIVEKKGHSITEINVNKNEIIEGKEKIQDSLTRAESPLWTYTLPAPPKFADDNNVHESMTITNQYYNDYESSADNVTTLSESNTTCVSDLDIKPIIKERHPIENHLYETDLIPNIHELENSLNIDVITSDIEDGYKGDRIKMNQDVFLETLKRRRENLVENEFAFLSKFDEDGSTEEDTEEDPKEDIIEDIKTMSISHIIVNHGPKVESPQSNTNSIKEESVLEDYENFQNKSEISEENVKNNLHTIIQKNEFNQDYLDNRRSSLSNFKIDSYTSTPHLDVRTVETKTVEHVEVNNHVEENKKSPIDDHQSEVVFRRPRDYVSVKRRSLTNSFISSPSNGPQINRSDSFHSTSHSTESSYIRAPEFKLTPRSSSYISLIGAQKFDNRISGYHVTRQQSFAQSKRKSSSELSITDSPLLQSVEVMKSIMKSSNNISLNSEKEKSSNYIKDSEIPKDEPVTEETKPVVNGNQIEVAQINKKEEDSFENKEVDEKDDKENKKIEKNVIKRWTYQGPPTISLSSWNERPKAQVSIKHDRDYKFGANAKLDQQNNKQNSNELQAILNKRKTISDFPIISTEKEDRLPTIRGVEYKSNVNIVAENILSHGIQPVKPMLIQNPVTIDYLASSKQISHPQINNSAKNLPFVESLDTVDKETKSLPAFVNRPQPAPVKPIIPTRVHNEHTFINNTVLPKPLTRNTFEQPRTIFKMSSYEPDVKKEEPPSFYKVTLRHTGLKSKILTPEPVNENIINVKEFPMRAAALRKIAEPIKQEEIVQTSTPVVTPPAPPPQKLAPIVRAVVKKPIPIQVEPRDQLLDAIRNFNKNKLNKSE